MQPERHVRLFRNGRNQAVRIPRDFEMDGNEAIIRKEGNKLILEPVGIKNRLLELLTNAGTHTGGISRNGRSARQR